MELDSTVRADQSNVGRRVQKDNTNTMSELLVRVAKGMKVPFREMRWLEKPVFWEVDILLFWKDCVCHVTWYY